MSKEKALEAEINWLKTVLTLLVAAVFGIFAWIVNHYPVAGLWEMGAAVALLVLFLGGVIVVNRKVYRNLRELEELE